MPGVLPCIIIVWAIVSSHFKGVHGQPGTLSEAADDSLISRGSKAKSPRKVITVPIEADENGMWYGNFTVGANQNQRLNIGIPNYYTAVYPGVYHPGPHSKRVAPYSTFPANTVQGQFVSVNATPYLDSIGIHRYCLQEQSEILVIKKTEPPVHISEYNRGVLPLSPASGPGTWLRQLCKSSLDQCRFGLSMGLNKKGTLVFGTVEDSLLKGKLTRVTTTAAYWFTYGHIVVNNKQIFTRIPMDFQNYNRRILGSKDMVRRIYRELNITAIEPSSPRALLRGHFPCDKPPTLGLSFPRASSRESSSETQDPIFNIAPSAMIYERMGNNKCVAVLQGAYIDENVSSQQVFYIGSGRYVDFSVDTESLGIGALKDPHGSGNLAFNGGTEVCENGSSGFSGGRVAASSAAALKSMAVAAFVISSRRLLD